MIPTYQTICDADKGNCWQACIASLLELPLEDVPHFIADYPDSWWEETQRWTEQRGFGFIEVGLSPQPDLRYYGRAYWIACGKSPRGGHQHAVVYRGAELIHDPHPDGVGLDGDPTSAAFFVLMTPEPRE